MIISCIAAFAFAATVAQPAPHDVWEADIALPTEPSPVYVLQLDNNLNGIADHLGENFIDVIDAKNRTMPRGYQQLQDAPHGAHRYIWFHDVGAPPYRVRVGAKSARRLDQISSAGQERLRILGKDGDVLQLPLAEVNNVRRAGTYVEQAPPLVYEEIQASDNNRLALIITALAALAVAALVAADYMLRHKLAELRRENP